MRRSNRFIGRSRSPERVFFTEPQILKFTRPRDQDSLTNLAFPTPMSSTNIDLIEVATTVKPPQLLGLAKGASQ